MDEEAAIITVLTVNGATEAEVVMGRLRTEGIDAISEPHSDLAVRPGAGSLGTVDILVREDQVAAARQILNDGTEGTVSG